MATTAAPVPVRSPLPRSLAGRTAVILGGSSGIGLAAAELLASFGARILLVGRDKERLDAAVTRVNAAAARPNTAGAPSGTSDMAGIPAEVHGMSADVADDDALEEVFERAGTVDHVLLTAGRPSDAGPVSGLTRETARVAVGEPVGSVLTVARAAVPRMRPGGSITLASGILVARPRPGMSALVAAAGAVETLARALAVELAPARLRVNAIRFGAMDTPLLRALYGVGGAAGDAAMAEAGGGMPLGRFGTAEEAASAALFLMANPYMSGEVLTVDGGQSLA
ncbi:SDR family NAD(P)-dependent oxidoreductase [Actinomadura latina]|nr:SDR family oxidoreductase [Actinomadura latina]